MTAHHFNKIADIFHFDASENIFNHEKIGITCEKGKRKREKERKREREKEGKREREKEKREKSQTIRVQK